MFQHSYNYSITSYIKWLWSGSSSPTKSVKQVIILSLPFKHKILPSLTSHYLSGSRVSSKSGRGIKSFFFALFGQKKAVFAPQGQLKTGQKAMKAKNHYSCFQGVI